MAVYRVGEKFRVGKRKTAAVFECQCGVRFVSRTDMTPPSCGCLSRRKETEKDKENVSNCRLKRAGKPFSVRGKSGSALHAVFQCECGQKSVFNCHKVKTGHTRSCGCFRNEKAAQRWAKNVYGIKHGGCHTEAYKSWEKMKARCENKSQYGYESYGGRGIVVCDRWQSFALFFEDMGERPAGMSIDRIDVNGNYEPGNCKWSTVKEQSRNKRNNRNLVINNESRTVVEWAEIAGIRDSIIRRRLARGWSHQEAVFGKTNE